MGRFLKLNTEDEPNNDSDVHYNGPFRWSPPTQITKGERTTLWNCKLPSGDRLIKLWDAQTGALVRTLEGHRHEVRSVAFLPDGRSLASSSLDGTVKIWRVETGEDR
jgi:WD40 repeat protein